MFYQQSQFTRKLKALKQRWWWVLRHSKTILTGIVAFLSCSYRLYLNWRIIRPRLFSTQKSRAANRDVKWRNMVENFGCLPFAFFVKLSTKWLIERKDNLYYLYKNLLLEECWGNFKMHQDILKCFKNICVLM